MTWDMSGIVAAVSAAVAGLGLIAGWVAWIVRIERVLTSIRDAVGRHFDEDRHGSLAGRVKLHGDVIQTHREELDRIGRAVGILSAWIEMDEGVVEELEALIRVAELRAKRKGGLDGD